MRKKGFTLIELMIVLAIIAILAVVLVPKASIFKNQARNSGVSTNVNAVRAYLENKTEKDFISDATDLKTALGEAFQGTDAIENPVSTSSSKKYDIDEYVDATANPPANPPAVLTEDGTVDATVYSLYKGTVIVEINSSSKQYTVYGVDNSGRKVNETKIK